MRPCPVSAQVSGDSGLAQVSTVRKRGAGAPLTGTAHARVPPSLCQPGQQNLSLAFLLCVLSGGESAVPLSRDATVWLAGLDTAEGAAQPAWVGGAGETNQD